MINIFVLFSVVFLIHEIKTFISPYGYDKQLQKVKSDLKEGYLNPNDRPFIYFNMIYFIWSVTGLFTHYWVISITLILFSTISGMITNKEQDVIKRLRLRRFDSLVSSIILITLLLTHYL